MTTATKELTYPRQSWRKHLANLKWRQGEHILVSAPTSAGKTTLASPLLTRRSHVIMLATKIRDATYSQEYRGWTRYTEWPKYGFMRYEKRILLWPKPGKSAVETIAIHRRVMRTAMNRAMREGGWCLCVDEGLYFTDPQYLGLKTELGMLHYTGRSNGISMVVLTQRPFYLPKIVLSSITHAYFARTYDPDDKRRLADIGGLNVREVADNLSRLEDRHDFLYLNPQGDATPVVVNTRK